MQTRNIIEKRILKEIQELPEAAQEKLEKFILFLKQEFLTSRSPDDQATKRLLALSGSWEDERTVDDQIRDIYENRKDTEDREPLK